MANLEVILKQDVIGVGEEGDIKSVKAGFARNYLLPKSLAVVKNKVNLRILEKNKTAIEERKKEKRESSKSIIERLTDVTVVIKTTAAENDKLFGSVTNSNISEALAEMDFEIDKRKIELEHPIKVLGEYDVKVKFFEGVSTTIKVKVERE